MRNNIPGLGPDANFMLGWFKRFFRAPRPAAAVRGEAGERLAAEFLRREKGLTVVTRNWRSPRDRRAEIDLVCRDGATLVFVEVKTRSADAWVSGYHAAVAARKRRAVKRACMSYLAHLARKPASFRFDVVEVALAADGSAPPAIRHFENLPLFSKFYLG